MRWRCPRRACGGWLRSAATRSGSQSTAAMSRMLLGDWDAVLEHHRTIAERYGDSPPGFLRVLWAAAEYVLAARGDRAAAQAMRECSWARRCGSATAALGLAAEGRMAEALDQQGKALQSDRPQLRDGGRRAAAARGRPLGRAGRSLRRYPRTGRPHRLAGWAAAADRGEAAIALAHGDAAAAEAAARRSCEGFAAIGAEWEAAVSALDLAEALRELGRPPQAREVLEAAAPALRRAGALAELDRLQALGTDPPTG